MPQVKANGITLEYESRGDGPETILLIMGLGAQMTRWPDAFVDRLAGHGFRVIRFDNRDVGLSERIEAAGAPDMPAVFQAVMTGQPAPVAYTLHEMAADAVGLLDALGLTRVHVVGASMGGMIGQLVAADYPQRVLSFTSIMSTTGNPGLPPSNPEAMALLSQPAPNPNTDFEAFLAYAVNSARVIGSPAYPGEDAAIRERSEADFRRSYYPVGFQRQYAAVLATGDRRAKLATITAPTVVIHGEADPLVPVAGGHDTAENIRGAELILIPGMGHDLPPALHATLAEGILRAVARSKAAA